MPETSAPFPVSSLALAGLALGGLALIAAQMDAQDPPSAPTTATAMVTAPITNTITVTGGAPASGAIEGIVGTSSLALVLATIMAIGLVALVGAAAASFLVGRERGRPSLTYEPRR